MATPAEQALTLDMSDTGADLFGMLYQPKELMEPLCPKDSG